MILGTGIDICEVDRMRKAITAAHGPRLEQRVFTALEIAYAHRRSASRFQRLAARFAAKEAGMKAFGTGWRNGIQWHDLEVRNLPSGRPTLLLHGRAAELAQEMGVGQISLSLTHTADQAMAMVILESRE